MRELLNPLKLFGVFTIGHFIFAVINLYQTKHIQPTFKELAKYNLYLLGIYWILNIIITMTFSIGVNSYRLPVWVTTIIYWGAGIIPTLIIAYLWFGQLPTLRQVVGLTLVLSGVLVVNLK